MKLMTYQDHWLRILLCLTVLLPPNAWAQLKSELRILTEHLVEDFDYNNSHKNWTHYINANLVEGLLSTNAAGEAIPGQAESWSISDDGLRYRFKLRDNIFWSDGHPVVAEDFVLAWRRMADPNRESQNKSFLHPLKHFKEVNHGRLPLDQLGVTAVDDRHLLVTLSAPAGHFLKILQTFILAPLPSHYSSAHIDKTLYQQSKYPLIVNGPYAVEQVQEMEIRLSKNPYYWDSEKVYYEKIRFIKSEDSNGKEAVKAVITGEADIAIDRSQESLQWVEKTHPEYFWEIPIAHTEHFIFNTDKQLFTQHADVRAALSMAIDREKLNRRIFKGSITPTYTFTPVSLYDFHQPKGPDWAKLDYQERIRVASEILKKRGISTEHPVSIDLKTQTYNNRHKVALAIKYAWRKLGVNVNIITNTTPETYKQMSAGDFQLARASWLADYPDPYSYLSLLNSEGQHFPGAAASPKIDQLLRKSRTLLDQKERELVYKEIEELSHEHPLIIPLYHMREYLLKSPSIQGVGKSPFITSMRWARPIAE